MLRASPKSRAMLFSISIRCYTLLVGVFFLSLVLCFRSCFTCPASPQFHLIPLIMINRHISYHHAFPFLSIYQYFTIEYQYYSDSKHFDLNSPSSSTRMISHPLNILERTFCICLVHSNPFVFLAVTISIQSGVLSALCRSSLAYSA